MVLKSYHNPVGLDYDIDDDPNETSSIGSTKNAKETKKKDENSKNKRQIINTTRLSLITCSKNNEHTEEGEWKTSIKRRRKPKANRDYNSQDDTMYTTIETTPKTKTERDTEEETKEQTRAARRTYTYDKKAKKTNKTLSAELQEDKKQRGDDEEIIQHKLYEQESKTGEKEDNKQHTRNKNTTTDYNEKASIELRKAIGIHITPQSEHNHSKRETTRTSKTVQNNTRKETKAETNNQEEDTQVISASKDTTNNNENNNMDTNTQEEGEIK
jgi:hypothetical protein